jgi:ribosome-binding protein aMBF1 (putative translation factor)
MGRFGQPDDSSSVGMRRHWVEVDAEHLRTAAKVLTSADRDGRELRWMFPVEIPVRKQPQIANPDGTVRQSRTYEDRPDVQPSRTVQAISETPYKARVAARIRTARKNAGFTQQTLGDRIGKRRNHVNEWENGKVTPTLAHLELIAQATGVTVEWLLAEDTHPHE